MVKLMKASVTCGALAIMMLGTGCGGDNTQTSSSIAIIEPSQGLLMKAGSTANFSNYAERVKQVLMQQQVVYPTTDRIVVNEASAANSTTTNYSTTNLIEQGVNEADSVQQDARFIYKLTNNPVGQVVDGISVADKNVADKKQLNRALPSADGISVNIDTSTQTLDVIDKQNLQQTKQYALKGDFSEFYLHNQQAVLLGFASNANIYPLAIDTPQSTTLKPTVYNSLNTFVVDVLDVTNAPASQPKAQYTWQGQSILGSRMIGDVLYVVSRSGLYPDYVYYHYDNVMPIVVLPNSVASAGQAKPADVKEPSAQDVPLILPKTVTGETLRTEDCYIPRTNETTVTDTSASASKPISVSAVDTSAQNSLVLITAIDLKQNTTSSTCIAANAQNVYVSPTSIYLLDTRYDSQPKVAFHQFLLKNLQVAYKASGVAEGSFPWSTNAAFAMNEYRDTVRLVTQQWEKGRIVNRLHVFAPSPTRDGVLEHIAQLPNATRPEALGLEGETIRSIRFMGDKAFVVTFRNTDPLYKINLSNAQDPFIEGSLKLPGFSSYLHQINNQYVLGVGYDADETTGRIRGIMTSVFDVSQANPILASQDVVKLNAQDVSSQWYNLPLQYDSKAIAFLTESQQLRMALPYGFSHCVADRGCVSQSRMLGYSVNPLTGQMNRVIDNTLAQQDTWLISNRALLDSQHAYFLQGQGVQTVLWNQP